MPEPPPAAAVGAAEVGMLRRQIEHLYETLDVIRSGGIDAVVVDGPRGKQVYSLTGADRPYRLIVERMGEGAATVSERGVILFANQRLASLVDRPADQLVGSDAVSVAAAQYVPALAELLTVTAGDTARAELQLMRHDEATAPALVSATGLDAEGVLLRCLVVTDLSERKETERRQAEEAARARARTERLAYAREVNDAIVQGLVAAEIALDLNRADQARKLIGATSRQARHFIGELLADEPLTPGAAVRTAAAEPAATPPQ